MTNLCLQCMQRCVDAAPAIPRPTTARAQRGTEPLLPEEGLPAKTPGRQQQSIDEVSSASKASLQSKAHSRDPVHPRRPICTATSAKRTPNVGKALARSERAIWGARRSCQGRKRLCSALVAVLRAASAPPQRGMARIVSTSSQTIEPGRLRHEWSSQQARRWQPRKRGKI